MDNISSRSLSRLAAGKGKLILSNGDIDVVDGPFDGARIQDLVKCRTFQVVPCTVGALAGKFELWVNEEGVYENELNQTATRHLGDQVFDGKLYGNVLFVRQGTVE